MKANFHHSWYLVEREFAGEGMKSLSVSVQKEKFYCSKKRQYQGSFEPCRYLQSMRLRLLHFI